MESEPGQKKIETDRLAELAHIGAGHAATALAGLVDRTIWIEPPVVYDGVVGLTVDPSRSVSVGDDWCTGVFFEFEGCFDSLVGLLFPREASEVLVHRLTGVSMDDLDPEAIESTLMEVGNILASHLASAIADALGERLLPSIPTLVTSGAEVAFEQWVDAQIGEPPLRVETRLHDDSGQLRGRLIVIPTEASASP